MSKDNLYEILSSVRTDVGLKRDHNEDNFFVSDNERIYIVADGMGGHANGEVASEVIRSVSEKTYFGFEEGDHKLNTKNSIDFLKYVIESSIDELTMKCQEEQIHKETGSTFVGLVLGDDGMMHYAHVGDSRLYLFREGGLTQLTQDHSILNAYLNKGGKLSEEDKENFPNKNIITKAIRPGIEADYDRNSINVNSGDIYLLCSDGLTDMVHDNAIEEILKSGFDDNLCISKKDLDQCVDNLINYANESGGDDNITVSLISINNLYKELPAPFGLPEPSEVMVEEFKEEEGSYTLENHEDLLDENKSLKSRILELEEQDEKWIKEYAELKKGFNDINNRYQNSNDQFESLYSQKGDLEEEIGKLQVENANIENESLTHNGELAKLENDLEKRENKLFDVSLENESLKSDAIAVVEPKIKVKNRVYGLLAGITLSVAAMVGYNSIDSDIGSQNRAQQEVISVDPVIEYQREINIIKTDLITEKTSCDTARESFQNAERLCPDMTDCQDIRDNTSNFIDDFCN